MYCMHVRRDLHMTGVIRLRTEKFDWTLKNYLLFNECERRGPGFTMRDCDCDLYPCIVVYPDEKSWCVHKLLIKAGVVAHKSCMKPSCILNMAEFRVTAYKNMCKGNLFHNKQWAVSELMTVGTDLKDSESTTFHFEISYREMNEINTLEEKEAKYDEKSISSQLMKGIYGIMDDPSSAVPKDLILLTSGDPIRVHKLIMVANSKVIATMLKSSMLETKESQVDLRIYSFEAVTLLVNFLYSGTKSQIMKTSNWDIAIELYRLGHFMDIPEFERIAVHNLCGRLTPLNALQTLKIANSLSSIKLSNAAMEFIRDNVKDVIMQSLSIVPLPGEPEGHLLPHPPRESLQIMSPIINEQKIPWKTAAFVTVITSFFLVYLSFCLLQLFFLDSECVETNK